MGDPGRKHMKPSTSKEICASNTHANLKAYFLCIVEKKEKWTRKGKTEKQCKSKEALGQRKRWRAKSHEDLCLKRRQESSVCRENEQLMVERNKRQMSQVTH